MDERDIEDLPYYIEYTGKKTTNIQFKHSASFKKALEKHLQDKYDSNNFGECLRMIVEDYLQHQCLEQKLFPKTIVGIAKESYLDNGISIKFLFVKDGYTQFYQDEVDKGISGGFMFMQVHKSSVYEFMQTNMLNKHEWDKLQDTLDKYDESEKLVVCEIALNNWMDSYDNGVYGLRADKSLHLGVNILNTPKKSYGIIYRWGFVTDVYGNEFIKLYGSDVENYDRIGIYDRGLVLRELDKYNKKQYSAFKHFFESYDLDFPKNAFERLKKQYEKKLNDKAILDEDIARMESKLKDFGYLE